MRSVEVEEPADRRTRGVAAGKHQFHGRVVEDGVDDHGCRRNLLLYLSRTASPAWR